MKTLMELHDGLARRTVDNPDLAHRLAGHGLLRHAADLRERGYTILENAITHAFADELREAILEKIAEHDPPLAAAMLLERGRLFEEAIQHPWVMALAEQVCGKGFLLAQSIGVRRGPGPGLPLHSDYNLLREPFPAYSQACTTIFALEDFTLAGGATLVVPGSISEQRHPRPGEADARAIPIEMPKGSIAMWDGATWHGSATRQTDGERVTLHNTYSRMTLRTYDFYRDIDPAILERNPPDVTTLAGLDDVFEKNTHAGPDFRRLAHATRIFRT
jgi:ectoine hydroxylase-related dioxygenase (phytanoyl-CoA dioxygenase family)